MPAINEFKIQHILNQVFDSVNNRLNIGAATGMTLTTPTITSPTITGTITQSTNVRRFVGQKSAISDNVATAVARISTTNEAGNNDAGSYAVFVKALISMDAAPDGSNYSVGSLFAAFNGVVNHATGVHTAGAVTEIAEPAQATGGDGSRLVSAITMTVGVGTARQADITLQVDVTGGLNVVVTYEVTLIWAMFITAPTLSAL